MKSELHEARDEHCPGQRHDRRVDIRRQPQRGADEADIKQHGRKGRHPEFVVGVEYARRDRYQRDEEYVRRGDGQQLHGEVEFLGIPDEARRADIHQYRRGDDAYQCHDEQNDRQHRGDVIDQQPGLVVPAPVPVFAEDRHERLRESAFGEQSTQQVGQFERHEERVGCRPRAEYPRDQHIAHKREDARNQCQAADGSEGFKEVHSSYVYAANAAHHTIAPGMDAQPKCRTPHYPLDSSAY